MLVFIKRKKEKSVSFYWTCVCERGKLTFVSFLFYEPFPYLIIVFSDVYDCVNLYVLGILEGANVNI